MVVVMFEIRFLILDYYLGPMPESCLPGITLMPCSYNSTLWLCNQTILIVVLLTR